MEQLEIAKTPPPMRQKIRRDAIGDGYRPRAAHFELDDNIMDDSMGCVSPIRSLWKSLWEDDLTNKRPLHTQPPMLDASCPESLQLYRQANELLRVRDEVIKEITAVDDELGAK